MNFLVQWLRLNAFLMKMKHDTSPSALSYNFFSSFRNFSPFKHFSPAVSSRESFFTVSKIFTPGERSVKCKMPSFRERQQQKRGAKSEERKILMRGIFSHINLAFLSSYFKVLALLALTRLRQ